MGWANACQAAVAPELPGDAGDMQVDACWMAACGPAQHESIKVVFLALPFLRDRECQYNKTHLNKCLM